MPCPQRVVQLPEIAWDQYTSGRGEFERDFSDEKRKTRRLKLIFDKGIHVYPCCFCRTRPIRHGSVFVTVIVGVDLRCCLLSVGLPARPKSPADSKKESDVSTLYSSLPSSDAPEHGMLGNRTQVSLASFMHRSERVARVDAVHIKLLRFHVLFIDDQRETVSPEQTGHV